MGIVHTPVCCEAAVQQGRCRFLAEGYGAPTSMARRQPNTKLQAQQTQHSARHTQNTHTHKPHTQELAGLPKKEMVFALRRTADTEVRTFNTKCMKARACLHSRCRCLAALTGPSLCTKPTKAHTHMYYTLAV